jgi:multidrug efflux pump subunit AcrA (membrane-fusion protein)
MDIARPDLKRRRRRNRTLLGFGGIILVGLATLGLARLEPAAPRVDRAQVWTDIVRRGEMLRQVRGNGSLVPEKIVTVQSDTGGTVQDILIYPGTEVEADTVLLTLSNPTLEQEAFDLTWQLKAAEAGMTELEAQVETDRFSQEATVTRYEVELEQAELEASASEKLHEEELEAGLVAKAARAKARALAVQLELEKRRLEVFARTAAAKIAVRQADLEKLNASLKLKQKQVAALSVKAGIDGVLQQLGESERLQIGERIAPGATMAKVVRPNELKAEIKIAETQARDIRIGQVASVDTRNGVIPGRVSRVDPSVANGTVTVDVSLEGALPKGARPDLSVDGTIELERLTDVLFVGRPVHGQSETTIGLFRVSPDGDTRRVPVKLGRSSVSTIEILEGLDAGDEVILSDMSQWDEYDRIKLK